MSLCRGARQLAALDPARAPIDARTPAQLMAQARAYARLLNFFDAGGEPVADWSAFWDSDPSFLLAEAASWADPAPAAAGDEQAELAAIHALAAQLECWHRQACAHDGRYLVQAGNPLLGMAGAIVGQYRAALQQLLQADAARAAQWRQLDAQFGTQLGSPTGALPAAPPQAAMAPTLGALGASLRNGVTGLRAQARAALEAGGQRADHPAHAALYLAFVRLYGGLQADLNSFTGRHLDYYYDTILCMAPAPATADSLTLVLGLAANCPGYTLPAGATASAGQDSEGKPILYATDTAVALNQISIGAIRTVLYVRDAERRVAAVYAAPVANSQDGLGQPLADPALGWPTFGATPPPAAQAQQAAAIGLLLTAPTLLLGEGVRTVTLRLSFADGAQAIQDAYCPPPPATAPLRQLLPADAFVLSMSTSAGWAAVPQFALARLLPGTDWELSFTLDAASPALAANGALAPALATAWPMLKLVLNPAAASYAYSWLEQLVLTALVIEVQVTGLAALKMGTPGGGVAPGKPFAPFGNAPVPGASWTLHHPELGAKQLDWVNLGVDWLNLPLLNPNLAPPPTPNGFPQYYDGYPAAYFQNDSFQVDLATFRDGAWQAPQACTMFSTLDGNVEPASVWALNLAACGAPASTPLNAPVAGSVAVPAGTLQVSMTAPPCGFGQALYPQLFAARAIENILLIEKQAQQDSLWDDLKAFLAALWSKFTAWLAKAGGLLKAVLAWILHWFGKPGATADAAQPAAPGPAPDPAGAAAPIVMLNPPFVPIVKNVSLSYHASETLSLGGPQAQIYHIHPFGVAAPLQNTLFPLALDDGNCYIGLLNAAPGQSLSMQIALRAAPASSVRIGASAAPAPAVAWRYLAGQAWHGFETGSVSAAPESGIVTLALPAALGGAGALMGAAKPALAWIAFGTSDDPAAWPATLGLLPQAVQARRVSPQAQDGAVLAAGSVTGMSPSIAQLTSVRQPYASSGGQAPEQQAGFRTRVSERLRHKQRASLARDYEQLVLDACPGVWQVRCVGPNNSSGYRVAPLAGGELVLVLVPPLQARPELASPFSARDMTRIGHYVRALASPCVRQIELRNPSFESLQVVAQVDFVAGADAAACISQLNQALDALLAPWLGQHAPQLEIGTGLVPVAAIGALIRRQPGVRAIASLTVVQSMLAQPSEALLLGEHECARSRLPWSVLVPAATHLINQPATVAEAACC